MTIELWGWSGAGEMLLQLLEPQDVVLRRVRPDVQTCKVEDGIDQTKPRAVTQARPYEQARLWNCRITTVGRQA